MRNFWENVKRRPWEAAVWLFAGWGFVRFIIVPIQPMFPGMVPLLERYNWEIVGFSVLVGLICVSYRFRPRKEVRFMLCGHQAYISVKVGDLLEQQGHLVIQVNEFFDGEFGKYVSHKSIHGQFITRFFNGNSNYFLQSVDKLLSGFSTGLPHDTKRPGGGEDNRLMYPIGTTVVMPMEGRNVFLLAFAKTNIETGKASADGRMMWNALSKLWEQVRASADGSMVNISLAGGGQSQVGLNPEQRLRLTLTSILVATNKKIITKEICIVLDKETADRIDLRAVEREWS